MADWLGILVELQESGGDFDGIRRKYLKQLHNHAKRNVIAYYSGWLQKLQKLWRITKVLLISNRQQYQIINNSNK